MKGLQSGLCRLYNNHFYYFIKFMMLQQKFNV